MGSVLTTHSKIEFDLIRPSPASVRIDDIAHALSMLCRFAGHTTFYSVAEHSVRVAELLGPPLVLEGLLHDAAEAYIVDVPSPVKHLPEMAGYRELDRRITSVIRERFELVGDIPRAVHRADEILTVTECRDLFGEIVLARWDLAKTIAPLPCRITPWDQPMAERRFRGVFADAYTAHLARLREMARPREGAE